MTTNQTQLRQGLIKRIKTLQNAANISQEAHLANVSDLTNGRVLSCAHMTLLELEALSQRYKKIAPKEDLPPQVKFIFNLWLQLKAAGKIDNGSRQGCKVFCKNNIPALGGRELLDAPDSWSKVIETLKAMLSKQGVVNG